MLCLFLCAAGMCPVSAAEPLSYEMPESKAYAGPGIPSVTPSKLGSKYYLKAKGGTPPYMVTVSGDAVSVAPRRASANTFDIIPKKPGIATLILKDNAGVVRTAQFTVSGDMTDGFKASVSDPVLGVGKVVILSITGGVQPYKVDFVSPVRYKVERLSEGSYRLTGMTAGGGEIRVIDAKGRTTGVVMQPAPFVMKVGRSNLTVGEETVLELSGGTAPYQFNAQQTPALAIGMVAENTYRIVAVASGAPYLAARDAQMRDAGVTMTLARKPVPINAQPLMLRVEPLKIHSHPKAVAPNVAILTVAGGRPPYRFDGGGFLSAESLGPDRFSITGKGQKGTNVGITVTDSEGRTGKTLMHLIPQFSGDCRTQPIKVGRAATFTITGGEPDFRVSGANPKIVRVSQSRPGGITGPRPGDPLQVITVVGLAPGSVTLMINDLNNMYSLRCPVTVIP